MHRSKATVGIFAVAILSTSLYADDWPQWQGPERNSISRERGLLQEWPKDGPPLAWKTAALGGGDSAPSVARGRVFGMSNRGEEEVVWALSEADGKAAWVARLGAAFSQRMPQSKEGPGCTPTFDGDRIYVEGLAGDVACLQAKDGKVLWQRSLQKDFGAVVPPWSFRESPLVDGDKVICTPGGPEATLVALNKMTGETIWKSRLPDGPPAESGGGPGGMGKAGAAYASPICFEFEGVRQYCQLTGNALLGVAASDGKFLWRYDKPANRNKINCSTPVYHDGHVLAASAYGAGGGVVRLSKEGSGGVKAEEVWFSKKMQNHHGGMVILNGCVYGANGGNEGGFLICLDFKTGNVLWDGRDDPEKRAPKGSVAFADGRLYYRTEKGAVLLLEPNSKEYIERGRFGQPDRTKLPAWAHPVVANGRLYIRDQDTLFCYDVKAK
jgi:outer membrane protein assembly factor BamB